MVIRIHVVSSCLSMSVRGDGIEKFEATGFIHLIPSCSWIMLIKSLFVLPQMMFTAGNDLKDSTRQGWRKVNFSWKGSRGTS